MTFLYPELPLSSEAAPALLAAESAPVRLTAPDPGPSGEVVRHVLIGSPEALRETIHLLHIKRYVEPNLWTGPVEIGPDGVKITQSQGQVLYYLMRLRSLDVPKG
ncbi:MAG: hypothetical protein ACFB5Z_06670 [Elainellaceae cyanobacterium]